MSKNTQDNNGQSIHRYNMTKFPSCFVTISNEYNLHMVFENKERALMHLKVCDGKGMPNRQRCNKIWEKAIIKMTNNSTCPSCKSDEAYGRMGNWDQCLMCGYIDKNPEPDILDKIQKGERDG